MCKCRVGYWQVLIELCLLGFDGNLGFLGCGGVNWVNWHDGYDWNFGLIHRILLSANSSHRN